MAIFCINSTSTVVPCACACHGYRMVIVFWGNKRCVLCVYSIFFFSFSFFSPFLFRSLYYFACVNAFETHNFVRRQPQLIAFRCDGYGNSANPSRVINTNFAWIHQIIYADLHRKCCSTLSLSLILPSKFTHNKMSRNDWCLSRETEEKKPTRKQQQTPTSDRIYCTRAVNRLGSFKQSVWATLFFFLL